MNFRLRQTIAAFTVAAASLGIGASHASADVILSWKYTASFAGTESSLPVGSYGTGIVASGGAINRTGLGTSGGVGSFNSTGWNSNSNFLSFSLTTTATGSYDLTSFQVQDRASGTGPRDLGLYYSGNNFASPIASWSDAAAAGTQNETATLSAVTLLAGMSYTFEIKPTDTISNNGGTTASAGTYRIISPTIALNGDLVAVGPTTPEPASLCLLSLGAAALLMRRSSKA